MFNIPALIAWAALFSPYSIPVENPEPIIEFKQHSFFVENACSGKECNVIGWYNDNDIIYLDETLDPDDTFHNAIVVHEITHWLQDHSGLFDSHSCVDSAKREREGYYVQNEYLVANANFPRRAAPAICAKPPEPDDETVEN